MAYVGSRGPELHVPRMVREHVTIRVTGVRVALVRFAIAAWIFRFGAWVAGCNIVVENVAEEQ